MGVNQLKAGALLGYLSLGLTNLVGLFYTPFLLRMLGQAQFGLYALVASVVEYLTILDFGFGNAIMRYTAKYRAEGKTDEQYSLFGMFALLYTGIGVVAFLIGLILYFNVENLFQHTMTPGEIQEARVMVMLLVFNIAVTFPFSIFGSIITAYENFVFQRVVNIIRILLQPAIMIIVLFMGYKAVAMVVVITVLNILTLLVNMWYCFARLHIRLHFSGFNRKLFREIGGYSSYVFIGIIIDKVYWSSGQFILGMVAGTAAVAVYAVAIQLQGYYMSFSSAMSGVFLPKVTGMVARNTSDGELSSLFIRIGRIQYLILGFILSGFIVFGLPFIRLWAGEDYSMTYYIALILMVPLTVPLIQCIGLTILQAKARLRFRSWSYLVIALVSFAISIPLARLYGGIGCAAGTSFCLLVGHGLVMNLYYARRIGLDIGRFWGEIGRMSLPVAGVVAFTWGVVYYVGIGSWLTLMGGIVLFAVVYIALMWRFSMNGYERELLGPPVRKLINRFHR